LFDLFVDALFDEDSFERSVMEFFLEFVLFDLEFLLVKLDGLFGVLAKHFRYRQLDWPIVFDYDNPAGDADLAVRECVQTINQLVCCYSRRRFQLNFCALGRKIVNFTLEFDFSLCGPRPRSKRSTIPSWSSAESL
jgi:hypothetical protein